MKYFQILLVFLFSVLLLTCAMQKKLEEAVVEKAEVSAGTITLLEVTPLATLLEKPAEYIGKTVLIEGKVTGRCSGTGCWVSLDSGNPDQPFYAKSPDHSFLFPADCVNKTVRIEGEFQVQNPEVETKDTLKHAEGELEEGHTCPMPVYYLNPKGIKIMS